MGRIERTNLSALRLDPAQTSSFHSLAMQLREAWPQIASLLNLDQGRGSLIDASMAERLKADAGVMAKEGTRHFVSEETGKSDLGSTATQTRGARGATVEGAPLLNDLLDGYGSLVSMKPGTALNLNSDTVFQRQQDGSVKLWKATQDKSQATTVPKELVGSFDKGIYGGRRDKSPSTDTNVQGTRLPTTLAALQAAPPPGITVQGDPNGRDVKLLLQDNISYWKDKSGNVCLQSRVGPNGMIEGNPDNPIYTLSPGEASKVAGLNGCGWYWTLSAPNQSYDPIFNPKPQAGATGWYQQDTDGNPIPISGQGY